MENYLSESVNSVTHLHDLIDKCCT